MSDIQVMHRSSLITLLIVKKIKAASSAITSWQIDAETMETVTDFIFLGSKITADCDYSHEIKRCFLPGRKAVIILDSILKSRDIILPAKVHLVKPMVFPAVMYGWESWNIKKAERWRCSWMLLMLLNCGAGEDLRVPWIARRSNQYIIKEISPEYSLEGLMLKLKLQYFGHLMWRTDSLEKTLMMGKTEGRRRRGWQRTRWLGGTMSLIIGWLWGWLVLGWTWVWAGFRSWWWTGKPGMLQSMGHRVTHDWVAELNWRSAATAWETRGNRALEVLWEWIWVISSGKPLE